MNGRADVRADLRECGEHPLSYGQETHGELHLEALAALDAEREAHQLTRTALGETRVALADSTDLLLQSFPRLPLIEREQIDAQAQENQRILGLAVAEADKPHDGNER